MKKYAAAATLFLMNNWLFSMLAILALMLMFIYDIAKAARDKGATL